LSDPSTEPGFAYTWSPDPDDPDWTLLHPARADGFVSIFGQIRVRTEGVVRARCRVHAEARHLNILGSVHGGFALAFIDQVLFLGPHALGIKGSLGGMTLDVSTQFFGPLRAGAPIDAVVDVLRETGRLIFLRGLLEQDGQAAVAFSGTIRKARA
jgi:acyl-coenzyme A thioesterase PaaI-like protein